MEREGVGKIEPAARRQVETKGSSVGLSFRRCGRRLLEGSVEEESWTAADRTSVTGENLQLDGTGRDERGWTSRGIAFARGGFDPVPASRLFFLASSEPTQSYTARVEERTS
jgi:hypothetical protein